MNIPNGKTVALVGESGSGKSVTALSILKLLPYPNAFHKKGEIIFKEKYPYFKKLDVLVDTFSIPRQMPIPL